MRKIVTLNDVQILHELPQEVQKEVTNIIEALYLNYGMERGDSSDGGFVAVLESDDDLKTFEEELGIELFPEYVETILTESGQTFTNTLVLCNNEFAITLIMPMEITPKYLKEYIAE